MSEPATDASSTAQSAKTRHGEILQTAAQLICRNGYEATSIQRIAEACGLTKAGLYHHIRSKEHLLLEINDIITKQQENIMRLEKLCDSIIERVRSLGEAAPADANVDEKPPHY